MSSSRTRELSRTDLDIGDNVLTFRLGDDPFEDTEQQVLVKRER